MKHLILLLSIAIGGTAHAKDEHGHDHGPKPTTKPAADAHDEHDEHDEHAHGDGHADEVKLTAEAIRVSGIKVGSATAIPLEGRFTVPARVEFNGEAMAHVGSPVQGRAVELKAKVGAVVKKGDELLLIESTELGEAQSDLIQKRTAADIARSTTRPAQESFDRAQKLYSQNESIALAEVQKRQAELRAAEGSLQTAMAAATAAENKLHLLGMDQKAVEGLLATGEINPKFVLRAPIGGTIIEREVTQGELVNPEKEALLVLADLSVLWVVADVPEAKLGDVQVGSTAKLRTVGSKEPLEGKVMLISPQMDANTRTGRVRIEIANEQGHLRPGMFASAELTAAKAGEPVLAVPEAAVQIVEGKPAVFVPVEGEANTFAKREVTVGKSVGGMVPVLAGLKKDDKYVTHGSFILKADLGKAGAAHEH